MNGVTGEAPDFPQTRLALRTWQVDRPSTALRSVTPAGGARTRNWIAKQMAAPEGNWPHDKPLEAACVLAEGRR